MATVGRGRCERVLRRLKKSELLEMVGELGFQLPTKISAKRELLVLLVEHCLKERVTPQDILKIELKR